MIKDIETLYAAVYIIFRKADKIAFLLRSNTEWMNNHYGLVAGKVDKGEFIMDAAIRETLEESGVELKREQLRHVLTSHRMSADYVWVDVVFEAIDYEGEPRNAEPDIHSELAWLDPSNLPDNMIPSIRHYIAEIEAGKSYTEFDGN